MENEEILQKSLNFDALDVAEKITGKSYKDDKLTSYLGFNLMLENSKLRGKLLENKNDVYFGCGLEYYLEVLKLNSFKEVLNIKFKRDDDSEEENFYIFWHEDGLLLKMDTYGGTSVNSCTCYYNWESFHEKYNYDILSSCSPYPHPESDKKHAIAGSHDGREGLITNMNLLRGEGSFLPKWKKQPFIWLLHYMDEKRSSEHGYYKQINKERIEMLPVHIQDAIKGE